MPRRRALRPAVGGGAGAVGLSVVPRLAVYGSLAPGEVNHGVIADLPGRWEPGIVRGVLHQRGWGAPHGFPGLVWHPDGDAVPVRLFTSDALEAAWPRLDRFEGRDYRRTLVLVERPDADPVVAHCFLIRWDDPDLAPALGWITGLLHRHDVPYQVTGGLAARVHGAERPLADVDLWVPGGALERIGPALAPHVVRPAARHRDEHWDLVFARVEVGGIALELGERDGAQVRTAETGDWGPVPGVLGRSTRGAVQGITIPVTPRDDLVALKRLLGRPVDRVDLAGLGD